MDERSARVRRTEPIPDAAGGDPDPDDEGTERTVTDLAPQARDRNRLNVSLDGAFAFGVDRAVALQAGLAIGDRLGPDAVAALRAADEVARATEAALAFLGYRPRTEREVRDRLREKGYAAGTVDAVVARLEGWRYLDDAGFARFWVENRVAHQPRGRRLLEQELRQKGVDRETAREAVDDAELDEAAAALALGRKRLASYAGEDRATARRRLGSFLLRRGFGYDVVRPALDRLLGESEDDPPSPDDE